MKTLLLQLWLVLALLWGLVSCAQAAPVTFEWTPDATHEVVHLKTVSQNQFLFLAEQTNGSNRLTVEMQPGTYRVAGTARKPDGRWAEHSDPIDVVVTAPVIPVADWTLENGIIEIITPGTRVKLTIEFSSDLIHWAEKMTPYTRFARIKAESP